MMPPVSPVIESLEIPAPVGGINAIAPATALPEGDCLLLYNLTAAELGVRVRQGWSEWASGLTGIADNTVRTVLPFSGSHKNGSTDKLFACTSSGIWDVTGQGATTTAWAPSTDYVSGSVSRPSSFATNGGTTYICTQSGVSAAAGGPAGAGTGIVDGTCHWSSVTGNSAPSRVVTFATQSGDAGYGVFTAYVTAAGRYLVYCDEENGVYVWSETGAAWTKAASDTTQAWAGSTTYLVGDLVANDSPTRVYLCTTGGVSAASGGPIGTGASIADGSAVWSYQHAQAASAIGPSLADQHSGFTGSPANFAAVTAWKSKLWFVEKDTTRAWYMPTGSIYGTATSFDFGVKMRQGGPLANLYNWSYDAGLGMDTLLVGISTSGDVVIYQGTDPSSASTFSIKGSWSVGGVPYGRRIATDDGGELLVVSLRGLVQMSKLIVGAPASVGGNSLYQTDKIFPLFNLDAQTYYSNSGWAVGLNPGDNALMCLVPASGSGIAAKPYVMSLSGKSWSIYRDLPMLSIGTWNGTMYFGTPDGRVAKVGGYADGVLFGNSGSFSGIGWSLLTGFSGGGSMRQKQAQTIQPILSAQETSPPINAQAKYNLDISEASPPMGAGAGGQGTFDNAVWDTAIWGGVSQEVAPLIGAVGMGRTLAVAVRGTATSRTSLVGIGLLYTEGGVL